MQTHVYAQRLKLIMQKNKVISAISITINFEKKNIEKCILVINIKLWWNDFTIYLINC